MWWKRQGIDALATQWVNACVAYLLVVWLAMATIEDGNMGESDPKDYDDIITTKEAMTIDAFSSWVIHAKMKTAHWGEGTNIMTQDLCVEDGSLLQGLIVQNTFTELHNGSKVVAVVVRNSIAYPHMLGKRAPVARAIMVTQLLELTVLSRLTKVLEEDHGCQAPKLTMKQWQEKLFEELDLSGLESWPPELVAATQTLLAEYHDIFLTATLVNLAVPIPWHM